MKQNVISLRLVRDLKTAEDEQLGYRARILAMDKVELLEEMVRYQEERSKSGSLTLGMMIQGRHLFKALEEQAETRELQLLSRSYRKHLEHELEAQRVSRLGS